MTDSGSRRLAVCLVTYRKQTTIFVEILIERTPEMDRSHQALHFELLRSKIYQVVAKIQLICETGFKNVPG